MTDTHSEQANVEKKIRNWFSQYEIEKDFNETIEELIRYNWLSKEADGSRLNWADERSEKYVEAFINVNRFFEFHEIEYADCPVYFSMAQPKLTDKSVEQFSPYITVIQDKNASGAAFTKTTGC